MGATKRVCEKLVILNNVNKKKHKFKVVRFGNVFASDGSVIPKIFRQIQNNESVTITDLKMERYFLTMSEACEFIIFVSTLQNKSGDVMFFKMGKPIKILDIAKKIGKYFGKKIKIKLIGIRKGEKIIEKLHDKKKKIKTSSPNIYGIDDNHSISYEEMKTLLNKMNFLYEVGDFKRLRKILLDFSKKY
jgi:FlaA1/EpsC-like NDP-sugar epimerase